MKVVADWEGWVLFERTSKSTDDWRNLKLVDCSDRRKKKKVFHFGWSDIERRLARNKDAETLATQLPEIHEWVVSFLNSTPVKATTGRTQAA